ncbi:glycosyltransferase [Butyrivibrio sp. AE3004]|uniref:glycosyltransferase n=1 Tax=Butyrivibrio sp. AE3004 TaxID=1506994 RepID=UPI00068EBA90|nr:glycosyltransferase [Butyrivibrio sp. AE3004]
MQDSYNRDYYKDGCGADYSDSEVWMNQFSGVAQKIIDVYNPKSFLDVGCAMGYLVACLRDLGVDAYGLDASDYAISQAREDIKPYMACQNPLEGYPENFPQTFDCVSTIEVAEHLREEEAQPFIHFLCEHGNRIIFSSTPDDIVEPSHHNVQQMEYWAKRFAKEGFYRDLSASDMNLTPQTMVFIKKDATNVQIVEEYEHKLRLNNQHFDGQIKNLEAVIKEDDKTIKKLQEEINEEVIKINEATKMVEEVKKAAEIEAEKATEAIKRAEVEKSQSIKKVEKYYKDKLRASVSDGLEFKREKSELLVKNEKLLRRNTQLIELVNAIRKDQIAVYHSMSWKITSPLRGIINLLTKGKLVGETPEYLQPDNRFNALLTPYADDSFEPWNIPVQYRIDEMSAAIKAGYKIALMFYDKPDSSTFRYACYNVYQHSQNSKEWRAFYFYEFECETVKDYLKKASLLIMSRTKWSYSYDNLIKKAKELNIPVVMQIDDLVCNLDFVDYVVESNYDAKNSEVVYNFWFSYVSRIQKIADCVDGFIVTNDYLGGMIKEHTNKDYAVIHNSLNSEQINASESLFTNKNFRRKGTFSIGYFSGSPTHKNDLEMISSEIQQLLADYADIVFYIVGYMEFSDDLNKYIQEGRIIFLPMVNFVELQRLISDVDVNIVPLVDSVFTNCKSELKFFEAAAVGTITCASPTYAYTHSIENGVDGFVCEPGQWYKTISEIHDGKYDIADMVQKARNKALSRYYGENVVNEIENAFNKMVDKK